MLMRLRVRKDALDLERAEEERLVRGGALLHDAGNAGEIEGQERERHGATEQAPLADGEGERAVEDDDQRPLRPLQLELLEIEEDQRLDTLVLVEAAVPGMPVRFFVADPAG